MMANRKLLALPLVQIDAFTDALFGGNPAAIMLLPHWLDDAVLQRIAAENNLSETAFLVEAENRQQADYELRWFTPSAEVELCGHATLASAWWLFRQRESEAEQLRFDTRSGLLSARRIAEQIEIDLPIRASQADDSARELIESALGKAVTHLRRGSNWIAVLPSESALRSVAPDFARIGRLHPLGLIITAAGEQCDFVSRYFAPSYGIDEDPVTGSAHADLAPYWADKLQRTTLHARQLSTRGGELRLQLDGTRVRLRGDCVLYLSGEVTLPARGG